MHTYNLSELDPAAIRSLCERNPLEDPAILETCRLIFARVRELGDAAVREYTRRFDGVEVSELEVSREEWREAGRSVGTETIGALEHAASNIRRFHAEQLNQEPKVEVQEGVVCWRERRPIDRVGLYIPGGNAILPSSVLMLGIPGQLAGCEELILTVPPSKDGRVAAEVLVAAQIAGVSRVFRMGGAQAIAALTFGTESIPKVHKLLGPGNRWVQTGKLLATFYGVAIDMVAGPSEVLVIADEQAEPRLVAADLLAQAEHGSDSQSVLASPSPAVIEACLVELEKQLATLPRRELAGRALDQSYALLVADLEEAFRFSNLYAPEHLILHVEDPHRWVGAVRSAGSVFLGRWSPEVAGDYASGTNHTLPTSGLARAFSGVSVDSFVKKLTFQELSCEGLRRLSPVLESLATLEGLEGHRRAVSMRLQDPMVTDL
jgi:histidinol dehydrogenase